MKARAIIERRNRRWHPAVRWGLDRRWNPKRSRREVHDFDVALLKGHAYRLTQNHVYVYGRSTRWRCIAHVKAAALTLRHHIRFRMLLSGRKAGGYLNAWRSRGGPKR